MSGLWEIEPNISSFLLLYHQFRLLATAKYTHGLLLFHTQTLQSQRKLCFHRGKMRDRKLFHRRCLYVNTLGRMLLIYHIRMNYLHILLIIIENYLLWGMYKTKYLIDQQEKYKALKTFLIHLNHSISF